MAGKFGDFMRDLEEEARLEGPRAVAESEAFKAHFRLARELLELRRGKKLTQRQLSAASGIQQSEISRIEAARANPTLGTISVIARALGAEVRVVTRGRRRHGGKAS